MRGSGTSRGVAVAIAACACLVAPAGASAAFQPIAAGDAGGINSYTQATYTMGQGERPTLQNLGPTNRHDVFSRLKGPDGKRLFISDTIDPGAITTLRGTEYLTTGSYAFFCNVHPVQMSATLIVDATGTPVPRPDIEVSVPKITLDEVASKGKLPVSVRALTQSDSVSLEVKLGKAVIGRTKAPVSVPAGQTRKVTLKLGRSGRAKLRKKSKATVVVTGKVDFGSPDEARKKLT